MFESTLQCTATPKRRRSTVYLLIASEVSRFGVDVVTLRQGHALLEPHDFGSWVGVDEDGELGLLQEADKLCAEDAAVVQLHEGILLCKGGWGVVGVGRTVDRNKSRSLSLK